jgi:hypothetical protein
VTVCIAAHCSDKARKTDQSVIACCMDAELSRGFTSSGPHLKWERLSAKLAAMLAAEDLAHADALLNEIRERILDTERFSIDAGIEPYGGPEIARPMALADLMSLLSQARAALTERLASDTCLPPGLSLDRFYTEGRKILSPTAYHDVWSRLSDFYLQCDLLIVGFDRYTIPHILTVGEEPPVQHDRGRFQAIGSGADVAHSILSAYDHTGIEDWKETAYRVLAAKRAAERAEGVGAHTLLSVVSLGGVQLLDHKKLDDLMTHYGFLPPSHQWSEIQEKLGSLDLRMGGTDYPYGGEW